MPAAPAEHITINQHTAMNTYIHLTTPALADAILASNALLMRPPVPKFGIDAVCAIDINGRFVPGVALCGRPLEDLVAVVFTTNSAPDYTYPEEAVWHADVVFSSASVMPAADAVALLTNTITDD